MRPIPIYLMLLMLVASQVGAADDFKVIKLEQDVRNLETQVRELSRQVAELQRGAAWPVDRPASPASRPAAPPGSPLWLDARNWERVQIGMTELEVIGTLGPPTSVRGAADASSRTLFYALEIGSSAFLGGSVQLKDRRVIEIQKPVLK